MSHKLKLKACKIAIGDKNGLCNKVTTKPPTISNLFSWYVRQTDELNFSVQEFSYSIEFQNGIIAPLAKTKKPSSTSKSKSKQSKNDASKKAAVSRINNMQHVMQRWPT